ncbi:hypothetical protein VKT23_016282 [Stygiomarasmius scandens]|uniref:Transmembrane protein n=1 Tax=Marasmiellus scandens TaxID=2682957 RepID=A0ABR1IVE0_9AGAR
MPSALDFPHPSVQALICGTYFIGLTVLSHCLSRCIVSEDLSTWTSIRQIRWTRLLILLVFVDSWLFLFSSGILVFGLGLETSNIACAFGIYLCVLFYSTSKLLIYFFLIERVHIVWRPTPNCPRFKSRIYVVSFISVCLCSVFVIMILFLWPLLRSNTLNACIRRIAMRTLVASAAALTTSTVNMSLLAISRGHERGWVCLEFCTFDIIVNALAIFWATSDSRTPRNSDTSQYSHNTSRTRSNLRMAGGHSASWRIKNIRLPWSHNTVGTSTSHFTTNATDSMFIGTTVGDDLHSPDHRRGRPPGLDECHSPPLPSKVVLQPSRKREKDTEDDHIEVWVETVRERHVESTEEFWRK